MFDNKGFDGILSTMLERVSDDVDKREGSVIYDALAPTAMELAEVYYDMKLLLERTFAATADGDDLERRVNEFGVSRNEATSAVRLGTFSSDGEPFDVPIGSRLTNEGLAYFVSHRISKGAFKLTSEEKGAVGNEEFGQMTPIEPIEGLGAATLADVLIPGQDKESDEALYQRYLEHIRAKAFGGNRADYMRFILSIDGVGGARLCRAPRGGGTVNVVIIDSDLNEPSIELIESVQSAVDPERYAGGGYGTAPIGHEVTVSGVLSREINIEVTLALSNTTTGQVEGLVGEVVEGYLLELRELWGKSDEPLTVRVTQIEARLLQLEGVQDVLGTTINGKAGNHTLTYNIPVLGSVMLNE